MNAQSPALRRSIPAAAAALLFVTLLPGWGKSNNHNSVPSKMGQVRDWSWRHVHYPQGASLPALALSQHDPRGYWNYLNLMNRAEERIQAERSRDGRAPRRRPHPRNPEVDWSVSLGPVGMAPNQYPAKYSFNVNATPDCTNDFVVYTINSVPSGTQANIAAFNKLYSGTAGGNGICGTGSATTHWAYQVSNVALPTSPAISLDGKKVAFVDGNSPAVFHVLTWSANQGTVGTPATPGAAQIVNLTLTGATTDTNSSPFIDYYGDAAYVGTDNGLLFKITGVFNGTPALAGAPWPLTVAAGVSLTAPVLTFSSKNIFVGGADGNLYGFTPAGAAITGSPVAIGSGRRHGGIVDPPLVDVLNGLIYVATGEDSGRTSAIVAQTSTASFASVVTAPIGRRNRVDIHAPAFNEPYLSGNANMTGTTQEWFLYACGLAAAPGQTPVLYRVGFNASRVMNAAVDGTTVSLSANNREECSPLTEFANGVDRLFLGLETSAVIEFFDISSTTTPTLGAPGQVSEAGGTTGIVVDNVSASNQASSIYFGTLGNGNCGAAHCAVKLTQSGLQ